MYGRDVIPEEMRKKKKRKSICGIAISTTLRDVKPGEMRKKEKKAHVHLWHRNFDDAV